MRRRIRKFADREHTHNQTKNRQVGPSFMGPLQVWPMVCGCRGSKNVTYRQQTTDKKVNTETPLSAVPM